MLKLINGILPDFVVDARGARFSELLCFTDLSRLDGVETFVDIKSLGIGESSDYVSFRAEQGQLKPIDRRAVKAPPFREKKHAPGEDCGPRFPAAAIGSWSRLEGSSFPSFQLH